MTNRPTPEQIAAGVTRWDLHDVGPTAVLDDLKAYGYVIVHPDDVPVLPDGDVERYCNGWNNCRARIFGDDR